MPCQAFFTEKLRRTYSNTRLQVRNLNCTRKADVTAREVRTMKNWIRSTWCKSMHNEAMWPMHGKYICPRCLLEYPVPWETPAETPAATPDYAVTNVRSISETVHHLRAGAARRLPGKMTA